MEYDTLLCAKGFTPSVQSDSDRPLESPSKIPSQKHDLAQNALLWHGTAGLVLCLNSQTFAADLAQVVNK